MYYCVSAMLHAFSPGRICITMDGGGAARAIKYSGALIHRAVLGFYRSSSRLNRMFSVRFFAGPAINIALAGLAALARPQHHARRALKPLGTIALLSGITCRESEAASRDLLNSRFRLHSPRSFYAQVPAGRVEAYRGDRFIAFPGESPAERKGNI